MLDHWLDAHDIVADDLRHLHSVLVLRYEDLVADPARAVARLAAFLQVAAVPPAADVHDGNDRYAGRTRLSDAQSARARAWGYGPGMMTHAAELRVSHALRSVREQVAACPATPGQRAPME